MELQESVPCSKEPATVNHLDLDESGSHHSIIFLKTHINIILPSECRSSKWPFTLNKSI
jgi:hypothetical protein